MHTTRVSPPRPDRSHDPSGPPRILFLAATLLSAVAAILGALWLLDPAGALYADAVTVPPLYPLIGPVPLYLAQLMVALLGVAGAIAASIRALRPAPLGILAATQVAIFGLGFGSMSTLSATGYLLGFAMPVVVLAVAVLLVRRGGRARWAIGVPALAGMAVLGVLAREEIMHLVRMFAADLALQLGDIAVVGLFVAVGAVWAAILLNTVRPTGAYPRAEAWVVRHRRLFTVLAALGPLPYALARLTWLTPWPLFGGEMAGGDPATRLWGLVLSTGCWLGCVLTIGLIRPWGEVFPRWFPGIGGTRVPVAVAAVPGFTVAALLCFAAVPVVLSAGWIGLAGMLAFSLIFPCWFWGPMLALAVWGYVGHRRVAADASGAPVAAAAQDR